MQTQREEVIKLALRRYIPSDPTVTVTSQNSVNWGILSNRNYYFVFPQGVFTPHRVIDLSKMVILDLVYFMFSGYAEKASDKYVSTDFIILDLKRPWFVLDSGCDWLYSACQNVEMADKFLRLVDETLQRYSTVFEHDGFMILKRK